MNLHRLSKIAAPVAALAIVFGAGVFVSTQATDEASATSIKKVTICWDADGDGDRETVEVPKWKWEQDREDFPGATEGPCPPPEDDPVDVEAGVVFTDGDCDNLPFIDVLEVDGVFYTHGDEDMEIGDHEMPYLSSGVIIAHDEAEDDDVRLVGPTEFPFEFTFDPEAEGACPDPPPPPCEVNCEPVPPPPPVCEDDTCKDEELPHTL